MGRHDETREDAILETIGDIPLSRQYFYDFDRMYIDDELGQPFPSNTVSDTWHGGMHGVSNKAEVLKYRSALNYPTEIVEAEACEYGRIHFVRIFHPAVPSAEVTRQYVWDENH